MGRHPYHPTAPQPAQRPGSVPWRVACCLLALLLLAPPPNVGTRVVLNVLPASEELPQSAEERAEEVAAPLVSSGRLARQKRLSLPAPAGAYPPLTRARLSPTSAPPGLPPSGHWRGNGVGVPLRC